MVLSCGGWSFSTSTGTESGTDSKNIFPDAISNATNRATLAASVIKYCRLYKAQGFCMDYEYLTSTTQANELTLFLQELNTLNLANAKSTGLPALEVAICVGAKRSCYYHRDV